jgi:hypothetical protein
VDPIRNPYSPGAGTPPPYLAGRERVLETFSTVIARAEIGNAVQPPVLSGLRGVGKTVLLLRWRELALDAGWAAAHIEARTGSDLRAPLGDAVIDLTRQVSRRFRNHERAQRLQRIATSFLRATGATVTRGAVAFDVQPEPGVADSGSLETDLTELLTELGEASRDEQTGAVILIDELQDAGVDALVGLVGACHRVNQLQLPVVVAGAGLPTVGRVLSEAKSYAERLFDVQPIGRLDDLAQRDAIREPAAALGVEFESPALARLGELAGGYPFFVQTHAKFAWDVAVESPITLADVAVSEPRAGEQLDVSFFGPRYERATPAERRYMHALASLGDGPVSTAEAAAVLKRRPTDVSVQRDGLLSKGLVFAPDRGLIDFTVPHMAAYLRRRSDHNHG